MTIYLTKIQDGKTHHFKASVEDTGVDITQGVFYNWLNKHFEGCGDNPSALARQKQLIDEKLCEGFKITEFKEIPENTVNVYDKAKWHYGGNFPKDLDDFQAFVHTGMFLGWLIDNDIVSERFKNENLYQIEQFKLRKLTGPEIFEYCCDGVLIIEDISEYGNSFALRYFDFDNGQYLHDYEKTLGGNLESLYHIANTWANYEKLRLVLDERLSDWKKISFRKPFWKFW